MKNYPTQASKIIDAFGGVYPMHRALGHINHTTVGGWKQRGVIPQVHHPQIWELAQQLGLGLVPTDFLLPGVGPKPSVIDRLKDMVSA